MTAQLCIAFTGVVAIWLSQDTNPKRRRWACIFGLCGQPFWFYSSFTAGQWGIFAMCFLYTWSWLRGVRNNWLRAPEVTDTARMDWLSANLDRFFNSPAHIVAKFDGLRASIDHCLKR